ncbi:hypothetical protein QEZ54_26905 [Catellatospora sp. KI3]|uniref:hypothetical protein n=1 Tax=Catellatospora sp. KI3 TaxID=3041620 RepID=UPI00248238A1|nr:hypothetical protein [Catellatospora sp. KI3]MDI1464604.1 hypothetical protein [Catellatospora sp. KI3]
MLGLGGEAEHQPRRAGAGAHRAHRHRLDALGQGGRGQRDVVSGGGQLRVQVQARADAPDRRLRQVLGQGGGQRVAAAPVDQPDPAQVPVVAAVGEQFGQGVLLQRR